MVLFTKSLSANAFFLGDRQQEDGDRTSENDMIIFYFNENNKESPPSPHPQFALCKNTSGIMSSSHQREVVTEPQAPREYLQATTLLCSLTVSRAFGQDHKFTC